jgi:outer membrane protein TolC
LEELSLSLPLWNWNQGNIAISKARKSEADARLLHARRSVEAEISRRYRAFVLDQKQCQQTPDSVVQKMREACDLADRQYRTGSISLQLYSEIQKEFIQVMQIRNQTLIGIWKNWLELDLLTNGHLESSVVTMKK